MYRADIHPTPWGDVQSPSDEELPVVEEDDGSKEIWQLSGDVHPRPVHQSRRKCPHTTEFLDGVATAKTEDDTIVHCVRRRLAWFKGMKERRDQEALSLLKSSMSLLKLPSVVLPPKAITCPSTLASTPATMCIGMSDTLTQ